MHQDAGTSYLFSYEYIKCLLYQMLQLGETLSNLGSCFIIAMEIRTFFPENKTFQV